MRARPRSWLSYQITRDLPGGKLEAYRRFRDRDEFDGYIETCRFVPELPGS